MTHLTLGDFERRYDDERDPWGYETSDYERRKYAATLSACGAGPFADALELAGSIGVFSAMLAPRCRALTTVDGARPAVRIARERLAADASVRVICGRIPEAIPQGSYDLVVASEILYYLQPDALDTTLQTLRRLMVPGATLVAVHWRPAGPERPFTAAEVHALLQRQPWLAIRTSASTDDYLLDVYARR